MAYTPPGFNLEAFNPVAGASTPPFTYSQAPIAPSSAASFSVPSAAPAAAVFSRLMGGGGGGGFSSQRSFGGGPAGLPRGHTPYSWGYELGRQFGRRKFQDAWLKAAAAKAAPPRPYGGR